MAAPEISVAARNLRQKVQGLRRSGIRYIPRAAVTTTDDAAGDATPELPAGRDTSHFIPSIAPSQKEPARHLEPARADHPADPAVAGPATDRIAALAVLANEVTGCTACAELARCRTQTVFGVGSPHAELCFIGEAPGADEDAQGEPFVGAAGQLLTKIIKAMGLERKDVYICNVLKCRPPGNRTPAPDEVTQCRGFLERQLDILQPKYICALGAVAAKTLLDSPLSIGRLRGRFHQFRGLPVLCTYHPAYLLRNPDAKRDVWNDIQILMAEMGLKVEEKGSQV